MVNINLSTIDSGQKSVLFSTSKIICIFIILAIWIGAYAGTVFYRGVLQKKIAEISAEQSAKESALKEGKNKSIFDFQTRLKLANSFVDKENNIIGSLNKMQELIVSGVHLSSYEYSKKDNALILVGETKDYSSVAKQVLNFKKSEYLKDVKIVKLESGEDTISFSIAAVINK